MRWWVRGNRRQKVIAELTRRRTCALQHHNTEAESAALPGLLEDHFAV
jgi:hypothetical protein